MELAVGPVDDEPILRLAGSTAHGRPHLAGLDGFAIDAELAGTMLVTRHHDRPGIVGQVGTLFGQHGVNIAGMSLSRNEFGGSALTVLNLDSVPSDALIQELLSNGDIFSAQTVKL